MRAVINPGDEVLIPQPSFVSYEPCAIMAGGVPVIIELKEENEFRLTAEELESAITEKTKIPKSGSPTPREIASSISLTISKNFRIPEGFSPTACFDNISLERAGI